MRALTLIFPALFSFSSYLSHATGILDEPNQDAVFSTSQRGMQKMPEVNNNILVRFFTQFMENVELSEQAEKDIQQKLPPKLIEDISNLGWEAEQEGNDSLAFACMRLGALGGVMADQEKYATYYLKEKDYKNAAKWYLLSALNNNPDVLSMLHRIDKQKQIMPYVNPEKLSIASAILEDYFKNENA